jgi:hypothetical protein
MPLPSSGLKSTPSKKPSFASDFLYGGFLLCLPFNPEDGGDTFL